MKIKKRRYIGITLIIAAGVTVVGCMTTGWIDDTPAYDVAEYRKAGDISVESRVWNVLFLKSARQRRDLLIEAAHEKARMLYGREALLANIDLTSQWSPYSLLLGLDLVGFVEDAALKADVLLPAPPPPEPEPEPEKVIRISYPILPQERYDDAYGYIGLEYLTRPEVLDKIKTRLDKRNADSDDYEREYAKVPDGGHLIIHIGRSDLMHANTRWYYYTVVKDGKVRIERGGVEGIPNIKGRDGNWWNIVTVPLETLIEEEIEVKVMDSEKELEYTFTITRLEEIL